ncbi:helix-turn-helix domain-containing protein [Anaerovibrio sp.]
MHNSPANIAADLGYTDQSHFSRQFKQITGVTPGNFANNRYNQLVKGKVT